jgi:hypothetical protein
MDRKCGSSGRESLLCKGEALSSNSNPTKIVIIKFVLDSILEEKNKDNSEVYMNQNPRQAY